MEMIHVQIVDVRHDKRTGGGVVLLKEEDDANLDGRILPIFIGRYEATAIEIALNNEEPPRPMTHDLLRNILEELGISILAVEITEVRDETYFAEIVLSGGKDITAEGGTPREPQPDQFIRISSRPSDAIALSVRVDCPIVVNESVIDKSGVRPSEILGADENEEGDMASGEILEEDTETIVEEFKNFIKEVQPHDFDNPPPDSSPDK